MNRSQKEELVSQVREMLSSAQSVVVTRQTGLTVSEVSDLRRKMREAGSELKVVKNTLARVAVKGTDVEGLAVYFEGPVALALSYESPVSAAKVVSQYARSNKKLEIVGGYLDGVVLDRQAVDALAKLPSLDELRARLVAVISTPATRMAVVSKEPAARLARVLAAYSRGK